jgi:hypothetical protein
MDFSIDLDNEYINTVLDQWMNEEGDNFMRENELPLPTLPLPELDSRDIDEILGLNTTDFDKVMDTDDDPYKFPETFSNEIQNTQEQEPPIQEIIEYNVNDDIINTEVQRPYDSFGFLPRYQERKVERGATEDTFFGNPLYKNMCDNKSVINIVSNGKDEDILALSNFAIQTPGVKPKCDQALESKLHVDATFALITKYNVTDQVCIYKRLAMLSDRVCLGCKTQRLKMVCLAGKFRCHHCTNNGRDVPFDYGFHQWLVNGCLSRHTSVI